MRHAEQRPVRVQREPDRDGGRPDPRRRRPRPCHARIVRRLAPLLALVLAGCGSAPAAELPAPAGPPVSPALTERPAGAWTVPGGSGCPRPRSSPSRRSTEPATGCSPAGAARARAASRSTSRWSTAASRSPSCAAASGCSTSTTRSTLEAPRPGRRRDRADRPRDQWRRASLRHGRAWQCAARLPPAPVRVHPSRPSRRRTVCDRLRPRALGAVDRPAAAANRLVNYSAGDRPVIRDDAAVDPQRARGQPVDAATP